MYIHIYIFIYSKYYVVINQMKFISLISPKNGARHFASRDLLWCAWPPCSKRQSKVPAAPFLSREAVKKIPTCGQCFRFFEET